MTDREPDRTDDGAAPRNGPDGERTDDARRPWPERLGLGLIAIVMAALFAIVAVAAGSNGEWILAAMSGVGAFMTAAVGLGSVIRG